MQSLIKNHGINSTPHLQITLKLAFTVSEIRCPKSPKTKSVIEYIRNIKTIAKELALVGSSLNKDELVITVLRGLGPDYKEISAAVHTRDTAISFQELRDKLTDHENFLKRDEATKETTTITAQFNQKVNNIFKRSNFSGKKGQSSYCSNNCQGNNYQGNHNQQGNYFRNQGNKNFNPNWRSLSNGNQNRVQCQL
ncbi:hypothetical protein ACOSP7_027337 [Xanthoceras sorbifolium]